MKLAEFVGTLKEYIEVSKLCMEAVSLHEISVDPEAFDFYLTCLELMNGLKALCGLEKESTLLQFNEYLKGTQCTTTEVTVKDIDSIYAIAKMHAHRTKRTSSEWNIKPSAKANVLIENIAGKLEFFYQKVPPHKIPHAGKLGILAPDLAKDTSNDIIGTLNSAECKPWYWLLSRQGLVIDIKQSFLQKLKGEQMLCADKKTPLTDEECEWVVHHSNFIEHSLKHKEIPETAKKKLNTAFNTGAYETKNIYGEEGVARLKANCMMSVLQVIRDKKIITHEDAMHALIFLCEKQEIEKVTIDDITCSYEKMQKFFPEMISFADYARFVIICMVELYVGRFKLLEKVMSTDRNESPKEVRLAKVLRLGFQNGLSFNQFDQHLDQFNVATERFASDQDGKLTYPAFKNIYDLIDGARLKLQALQPTTLNQLNQSWRAVRT